MDWSAPTEKWTWTDSERISHDLSLQATCTLEQSRGGKAEPNLNAGTQLLGPPFDLILTADTIYSPTLIAPLLRTLQHLAFLSPAQPKSSSKPLGTSERKRAHAPLYVALEARDPALIASFFVQAHDDFGFACAKRVPAARLRRAMVRAGLGGWARDDWEGVEIWRMVLEVNSIAKAGEEKEAVEH